MNYHFDPDNNSLSKSVEWYWDDFYRQVPGSTPQSMPPSQFAAFCCVELRILCGHVFDIHSLKKHFVRLAKSKKSLQKSLSGATHLQ